jgi:hypothetical protein
MLSELRKLFSDAMARFAVAEHDIIIRGVSERGLCSRLAMVLEPLALEAGLNGYRADVEYNRGRGTDVKLIVGENWRQIAITCDLILHSRGALDPDNLIAVEMKRSSHDEVEKAKDRARLRALTDAERFPRHIDRRHQGHVFGYEVGYFVELRRDRFHVEEYQSGRHVADWIMASGTGEVTAPKPVNAVARDLFDLR